MFKRFILVLILMLFGLGAMVFAQGPGVFLPFYFIKGNITDDSGKLINHNVVIYQSAPQISISLDNNVQGTSPQPYMINIFRAQYFGEFSVQPGTYQIGVPIGQDDGWGKNPEDLVITGQGYEIKNFILVSGEGQGLLPPAGTVPLTISYGGSNFVHLTWDKDKHPNIDIWKRKSQTITGYGSGEFTNSNNDNGWIKTYPNKTEGALDDHPSFAVGAMEMYYKAVDVGQDAMLPQAWAVGKYDYDLKAGYNLISAPLAPMTGGVVGDAFYGQLNVKDVEIYARDDASAGYSKSQVIDKDWVAVSGGDIYITPGRSYWLRLPADKRFSLLGAVGTINFARSIYGTNNPSQGYNLIGWPFPSKVSLDAGGAPARGTDAIFKRFLETGSYQQVISDGIWKNSDPNLSVFEFTPGAGYWYRNTANDFNWTAPAP